MRCKICGTYEPGNYTTCKACLNKGFKWCASCKKVLPLNNFRPLANGYKTMCRCCEPSKEKPKQSKPAKKVIKPKCSTCMYSFYDSYFHTHFCQYIIIEGKPRGCDAANCTKYKKRGKNAKADRDRWAYY